VGRNTGLLAADALNFTGQTVIGIVDSTGALARRITVDFDAGTITTENPADTRSFTQTVGGFTTTLNAVLQLAPATGTASFANGVLTLDGSSGIVLGEVDGDPSSRAGRSFAHFFGLNDVIRSEKPTFAAAGVSATDAHGLAGGGAVRFQITDAAGRLVLDRNVTVTGTTWADIIAQMNSTTNGFGQYGVASLDSSGAIKVTPGAGYSISAVSDTTRRGTTGLGVTDLFSLGRASLAASPHGLAVDQRIVASPALLALGKPDLTADIGARIAESGDARGAQALISTRNTQRTFPATGALSAQTTSLNAYTSRLAGEAARLADNASRSEAGAKAVFDAATERRTQSEGVSLDEELVRMTQFQQSYAAASRLIQAAQEMLDTLLAIR
jgi:flagellar hook-associated protein 1 FlgK